MKYGSLEHLNLINMLAYNPSLTVGEASRKLKQIKNIVLGKGVAVVKRYEYKELIEPASKLSVSA